jgi:hypothetical protein
MLDDLKSLDPVVRVFIEACIMGLLVMLVGIISGRFVKPYFKVSLPEICKKWNKKNVMEVSLFMTGFILHILLEITGINKQYASYKMSL